MLQVVAPLLCWYSPVRGGRSSVELLILRDGDIYIFI